MIKTKNSIYLGKIYNKHGLFCTKETESNFSFISIILYCLFVVVLLMDRKIYSIHAQLGLPDNCRAIKGLGSRAFGSAVLSTVPWGMNRILVKTRNAVSQTKE